MAAGRPGRQLAHRPADGDGPADAQRLLLRRGRRRAARLRQRARLAERDRRRVAALPRAPGADGLLLLRAAGRLRPRRRLAGGPPRRRARGLLRRPLPGAARPPLRHGRRVVRGRARADPRGTRAVDPDGPPVAPRAGADRRAQTPRRAECGERGDGALLARGLRARQLLPREPRLHVHALQRLGGHAGPPPGAAPRAAPRPPPRARRARRSRWTSSTATA